MRNCENGQHVWVYVRKYVAWDEYPIDEIVIELPDGPMRFRNNFEDAVDLTRNKEPYMVVVNSDAISDEIDGELEVRVECRYCDVIVPPPDETTWI